MGRVIRRSLSINTRDDKVNITPEGRTTGPVHYPRKTKHRFRRARFVESPRLIWNYYFVSMEPQPGEEKIEITSYRENSVGKNFSATKIEYIFEFFINGKQNILKLVKSTMSGKLRIFLNENLIHFDQK